MHVWAHVQAVPRRSDTLELELWIVVSCHMGPLQEKQKLLTAEPSLPPLFTTSKYIWRFSYNWKFVTHMLESCFKSLKLMSPLIIASNLDLFSCLTLKLAEWIISILFISRDTLFSRLNCHKERMSLFIGNHLGPLIVPKMSCLFLHYSPSWSLQNMKYSTNFWKFIFSYSYTVYRNLLYNTSLILADTHKVIYRVTAASL